MPSELWLPSLSPKDEKQLNRLRNRRARVSFKWTGFAGKTLWDWLQLLATLAIPIVVAFVSISFSLQQDVINQQQHKNELKIAQDNRQNDLRIANGQQQEALLKTCLDDMANLLLNDRLRVSQPDDEVRQVAQVKIFTALRMLDPDHKGILLQFLQDAQLINTKDRIIALDGVDLRGVDLHGVEFQLTSRTSEFYFSDLAHVNLSLADLDGAHLSFATLRSADLSNAQLSDAILSNAQLSDATLSDAILSNANLGNADLSNAKMTDAQLAQASLLYGTVLPNGSRHGYY